jgi:hypothetical protein
VSDDADLAQMKIESEEAARMSRLKPYHLAAGHPGECDYCGKPSRRLINGGCAPCRDERRLP